jgi:hypothetical protein
MLLLLHIALKNKSLNGRGVISISNLSFASHVSSVSTTRIQVSDQPLAGGPASFETEAYLGAELVSKYYSPPSLGLKLAL